MEEAGKGLGTMAVILNLDEAKVAQLCKEVSPSGIVEPANVNCPGQIVISGEKGYFGSLPKGQGNGSPNGYGITSKRSLP